MKSSVKPIPSLLAVSLICLLGILVYSNTLHSSWHFDDYHFIYDNPSIEDITDWKAIHYAYDNPARSVPSFTFALNYHFGRYDVFGYHIVNIAIHLITSTLVYFFTILILCTPRQRGKTLSNIGYGLRLDWMSHENQGR